MPTLQIYHFHTFSTNLFIQETDKSYHSDFISVDVMYPYSLYIVPRTVNIYIDIDNLDLDPCIFISCYSGFELAVSYLQVLSDLYLVPFLLLGCTSTLSRPLVFLSIC